jgi:GH15 family glucan-1,4-alpha-glucosidase
MTEYVAEICHQRTSGIWEQQGTQRQFTYSKVMAWLALDQGVKAAERHEMQGPSGRWIRNT